MMAATLPSPQDPTWGIPLKRFPEIMKNEYLDFFSTTGTSSALVQGQRKQRVRTNVKYIGLI